MEKVKKFLRLVMGIIKITLLVIFYPEGLEAP